MTGPLPRERCGVAAASGPEEQVFIALYRALLAINHRGQESYGILVNTGEGFKEIKGLGLVPSPGPGELSSLEKIFRGSPGIAHVRYATSGNSPPGIADAHPVVVRRGGRSLAIAYNGNIVNARSLREELRRSGARFQGSSDAEILGYVLLEKIAELGDTAHAVRALVERVEGAYSVIAITDDGALAAFRDPRGIRPLVYGYDEARGMLLIASESPALDMNSVPYQGYLRPGDLLVARGRGFEIHRLVEGPASSFCSFELAYFMRPDSRLPDGRHVYEVRRELGRALARRYREIASRIDAVIPIPQTAVDAAYGFHEESGKPLEGIVVKHPHVRHRAFIMPPGERIVIMSRKYNVIAGKAWGRRLALIDDSIVRGETLGRIVSDLRRAGAREIHVFSTFPKISHPCFYGIDMATYEELVAFERDPREIARIIGADSVNYQTLEDFLSIAGPGVCTACATGIYPTPLANEISRRAREMALAGIRIHGRALETLG